MKKIYIFPKYSAKGASSRYRIYSYLRYYDAAGFKYSVNPLFGDAYLNYKYQHRSVFSPLFILKVLNAYIHRFLKVLFVPQNSIVYIGAELLPYVPLVLEKYLKFRNVPIIIEYDDAIFHNYDQNKNELVRKMLSGKTPQVIKCASLVICGSRYLKEYALNWNHNVIQIPTCVDSDKYLNKHEDNDTDSFVVGWIGSPSTSKELSLISTVLIDLQDKYKIKINLIGFDKSKENLLKGLKYNIIEWSSDSEIKELNNFTIGVMPLFDTPFNRGKCAFKLVQYMMMGIPTVSTPLQSNIDIDGGCGNLFASTRSEWFGAIEKLLVNKELRNEIGNRNWVYAHSHYSFQMNKDKYIKALNSLM